MVTCRCLMWKNVKPIYLLATELAEWIADALPVVQLQLHKNQFGQMPKANAHYPDITTVNSYCQIVKQVRRCWSQWKNDCLRLVRRLFLSTFFVCTCTKINRESVQGGHALVHKFRCFFMWLLLSVILLQNDLDPSKLLALCKLFVSSWPFLVCDRRHWTGYIWAAGVCGELCGEGGWVPPTCWLRAVA